MRTGTRVRITGIKNTDPVQGYIPSDLNGKTGVVINTGQSNQVKLDDPKAWAIPAPFFSDDHLVPISYNGTNKVTYLRVEWTDYDPREFETDWGYHLRLGGIDVDDRDVAVLWEEVVDA